MRSCILEERELIPELIVLALLIGWLCGGKFSRLADLQVKQAWLIFIPVIVYFAGFFLLHKFDMSNHSWVFGVLHLTSIAAFISMMIANLNIRGTKLIVLGLVLNAIAISINGGFMPASPKALDKIYGHAFSMKTQSDPHFRSSMMNSNTKLTWLCDIIPARLPVKAVYSVGDLWMSAGIAIALFMIMRTPVKQKTIASDKGAELDAT